MEQYAKCIDCRQGFFYHRESYHGRVRSVCDKCKQDHEKNKTKERVRKHRMNEKKQRSDQPKIHIQGCNGKTMCGRGVPENRADKDSLLIGWKRGEKHNYCRTCLMAFVRATGGK